MMLWRYRNFLHQDLVSWLLLLLLLLDLRIHRQVINIIISSKIQILWVSLLLPLLVQVLLPTVLQVTNTTLLHHRLTGLEVQ
jgi:hypothetical protein